MGIFEKRINILPLEYPELMAYKDAIRHSYWLDDEFNFTTDIQHFHINISEKEKTVLTRSMLAIAQIELAVKTFWMKLYDRMPKYEIASVGATFGDSEARHADAYKKLIEVLGLQDQFDNLIDIPEIKGRINYLQKYTDGARSKENKMYTKSVLLFSLLIENVSLFSQFYTIMSFNKYKNLFKGISNVIEATSKEEVIHSNFGAHIIKIIKSENPDWFDEDFYELIRSACKKAYIAEAKIINWIFEKGELDFISTEEVKEFIKNRINQSVKMIDMEPIFEINKELVEKSNWFEIEMTSTKEPDFFNKRSIDYNKKSQSITKDDLF